MQGMPCTQQAPMLKIFSSCFLPFLLLKSLLPSAYKIILEKNESATQAKNSKKMIFFKFFLFLPVFCGVYGAGRFEIPSLRWRGITNGANSPPEGEGTRRVRGVWSRKGPQHNNLMSKFFVNFIKKFFYFSYFFLLTFCFFAFLVRLIPWKNWIFNKK